jgi:hypothetical protein
MNKEILNEINRFREISGLRLLSEASIGGGWIDELLTVLGKSSDDLDTFIKSVDNPLAQEFRDGIEDVAARLGKQSDEILERIRLKNLEVDEADELLKILLKSTNKEVKDTLTNYFINSDDSLKQIADEMVNGDVVDILKTSQLPYDQLNDYYRTTRESFVRSLSDELPEIQENLLKRFDDTVKPLLDDIAKKSATSTTKKVTLSSIKETTNNFVNSIRPKTYSEQFDDVLSQIQKDRIATNQTPLTNEQIDALEGYITEILGKQTGTVQEVLDATKNKLDELINIAKTGDEAAKKEARKTLIEIYRNISCADVKTGLKGIPQCIGRYLGAAAAGTILGIGIPILIYLILEYEIYASDERQEDIQKIIAKIGNCVTKDDISIDIGKIAPETDVESEYIATKTIRLKVTNSKGEVEFRKIKWDDGKESYVDAMDESKIIKCAGGSSSLDYKFGGEGGDGGEIAAPTDTEFKEWAKIEYKDYPESLEKINAVTPTISGNNVIIVVDGNTLTYTKTADKTFVQQ